MFFYQGDEVDIDFEFVNTFGHLKREFELKVMARCNYDRNTDSAGIIVQNAKTMKLDCTTCKPGIFLTIETDRAFYWLTCENRKSPGIGQFEVCSCPML